ncbi:MAG: hypothetical protein B6241_13625 [Spirochaetaceae bacterium 4572_59]|nr:MAG: hypothetical protein B6241_13625 [Spirochaetaceae bacterium 4572_59]
MAEQILSVGIDIGTSTTHLVFSRLTLENISSLAGCPNIQLSDKEVVYRSAIYKTPLLSRDRIDGPAVKGILAKEYERAGIPRDEVETGAVIITGETARKENAREVLHALSDFAGDFVVAAAGPALEAVLSGKGAGIAELSRQRGLSIANIDIGGGTSNIAVFKNGESLDTSCLDIGGSLVEFSSEGEVVYIADKLLPLIREEGIGIVKGSIPREADLLKLTRLMSTVLGASLKQKQDERWLSHLITDHPLEQDLSIDAVSFSGGVSEFLYGRSYKESPSSDGFHDIGNLLGNSLREADWLKDYELIPGEETIRATVVGAGCHATSLSGSTISVQDDALPLRNLPVIGLNELEQDLSPPLLSELIRKKADHVASWEQVGEFALTLPGRKDISYGELCRMAEGLVRGLTNSLGRDKPLVVAVEQDIAKALGGIMKRLLPPGRGLISIDRVQVRPGDFLDIGRPVAEGTVVPVVVKTLAFG